MKLNLSILLLAGTLFFSACSKDEDPVVINPGTVEIDYVAYGTFQSTIKLSNHKIILEAQTPNDINYTLVFCDNNKVKYNSIFNGSYTVTGSQVDMNFSLPANQFTLKDDNKEGNFEKGEAVTVNLNYSGDHSYKISHIFTFRDADCSK